MKRVRSILTVFLAFLVGGGPAFALPTGWEVLEGNITVETSGSGTLNVTSSSQNAIVQWQTFNVGSGETVNFFLPDPTASILNRILGGPSNIAGALNSNGTVLLVNPAGINIGATANINTGGFIASTLNISNPDYLSGNWVFSRNGESPAGILNEGTITTSAGGFVVLAGGSVANHGNIFTPDGTVNLAVGDKIRVDLGNNHAIDATVTESLLEKVEGLGTAIQNTGVIDAHTIKLEAELKTALYDQTINNTGVIRTTSASREGTSIKIYGYTDDQLAVLRNGGTLDTSGSIVEFDGGSLEMAGDIIYQDGNMSADGATGGNIVINASDTARLAGNISAFGNASGGSITASAGKTLDLSGNIDATAQTGYGGTVALMSNSLLTATAGHHVDVNGASGGSIQLESGGSFTSGTYLAQGTAGTGGQIDIGGSTSLLGATLDASGATGGGRIRVGGEFQGGKNLPDGVDEVKNAQNTLISQGTTLNASALGPDGDGGEVIVWSDGTTHFYGDIDARPGTQSGVGGFVEISGSDLNLLEGSILTGQGDRTGSILLDPKNLYIQDAPLSGLNVVKLAFGIANSPASGGFGLNDGDDFGTSMSLNGAGDILAVGANGDDTGGSSRGAAYLFNLNPADLTQAPTLQYKLAHGSPGLNLNNGDNFGFSLALNDVGDILAVGANGDDTGGSSRGAAYLFNLNPADLTQAPTLQYKLAHGSPGLNLNNGDNFGFSLALNGVGDILAVGAIGDDTGGINRGTAHLFNLNPADLTQAPTFRYKLADGSPGLTLNNTDLFGASLALNNGGISSPSALTLMTPVGLTGARRTCLT